MKTEFHTTNRAQLKLKLPPPQPICIRFNDPATGEFLGEFLEKDGVMTFEGQVDEAGKVFVDWICESFNQRIETLIGKKDEE